MFSREAGMYMWQTIPFDKIGWDNVEQRYKDVMNHLRENFNIDEVERDYEAKNLKGGMRTVFMKRYSDRKYEARQLFDSQGGYDDLERARAYHPVDMPYENWLRTIEFRQEKYIKKSKANRQVCEKQQFPYYGGTSSYDSTAYKNVMFYNLDWVPTYAKTHTDNQGNWVDPDFVNSLFQTPSFLSQLNNYLASQGKGKGKSNDYDSDDLYDRESEED
ncbi:hypothetical protein Hdeb2414_s0007g00252201 [Helianthus debilis subsp. tardiflorus]